MSFYPVRSVQAVSTTENDARSKRAVKTCRDEGELFEIEVHIFLSEQIQPPESPIHDNKSLLKMYERVGIIAWNSVCTVFDVIKRNVDASPKRALKINFSEPPIAVIKKIAQLNLEHVVKIDFIGRIQVKPKDFISELNTSFVQPLKKNAKTARWASVYEMERMEGNLKELQLLPQEKAAIEVQRIAIEAFLYNNGIVVSDIKDINVLWKTLPGQTLPDEDHRLGYDYWKCQVGSDVYYLPRGKYAIKLTDLDDWSLSTNLPPLDFAKVFKDRLKYAPKALLDQIAAFKTLPKKRAKVLDFLLLNKKYPLPTRSPK
ncbi:MAG: hypothetical protein JSR37_08900 [Verrucomicrobia bacterium]|nr:hypothetical protein [Verrucomicrobiota bacterium]MBS0637685.1 hypothetical protein [Verrucomicrobiota bacterium]